MKLNEKNFKKYNSDTETSILGRISEDLKTVPFWVDIKKKDGETLLKSENVTAINVLDKLKSESDKYVSYKDIESTFNEWIYSKEEDIKDPRKELAIMYIVIFTDKNGESIEIKVLLEDFFKDYGGTEFNWTFIENVISTKNNLKNNYQNEVKLFETQMINLTKELEKTEFTADNIELENTNFLIDHIVTTINITTETPLVLSHAFNNFTSEDLLFSKYLNYFKLPEKNKQIIKFYDYDSNYENDNFLLIFYKKNGKKFSFREIIIKELSPTEFSIDIDTKENTLDFNEIQNILLDTGFVINSKKNTSIKGCFYIKNSRFHPALFLDEVMNNKSFSNLYNNERFKVTKNYQKINLYFTSLKTGIISFSLSNDFGNVKIKANKILNEESIPFFQTIFLSLFEKYKSREKMIFNIYKKIIPSLSLTVKSGDEIANIVEEEDKIKKVFIKKPKNHLAEKEPTLFITLYTRKCSKPPRILDDDENVPDNLDTMNFPIFNEGGLKPRKYVCDQTGHFKYPGLRKNTLPNNDTFPYIPCCYETNQKDRKGSCWNTYFNQTENKNEQYEHVIYKTSRILPNENHGSLPVDIVKVLSKNGTINEDFSRHGIFIGPNSFIDCISRIAHKDDDDIYDDKARQTTLIKIRKKLMFEYCAQENSDISNYREWFENPDLYFEPRRFYRALEEYFKINIFIFEKSTNKVIDYKNKELIYQKTSSPLGILGLPNIPSKGVYIDSKRFKKNAYVYVHMGGAVDFLSYPHCEYIKLFQDIDIVKAINKNVLSIYREMLLIYKTPNININEKDVQFQYLDKMGRAFELVMNNNTKIRLDYPIQPLGVPIKNITIKPQKNLLDEYIRMNRLARVFLEYCMVKFSQSDYETVEEFLNNNSDIDLNFKYNDISPHYETTYYDTIFTRDERIIFDSEDTRNRIGYNMDIIYKRDGLIRYKNKPFIYSYFQNNLDFDNFITNEDSFKIIAYSKPQGVIMNNFLEEPTTDLVIVKDKNELDLNGYYGVYSSLTELKYNLNKQKCFEKGISSQNTYYIWDNNQYNKYYSNGTGLTIIVYKINSTIYYLGKFSNI